MGNKTQVVTATVVFEAEDGNDQGLRRHILNALKASCRNARNARVALVLHDEEGTFLGMDVLGNPSEEMQSEIDALQDDEVNKSA